MIDICGSYCGNYYGNCYRDCCEACYKAYCRDYWWVRVLFIDLAYCTSCLGAVGVKEDILVFK